MTTKKKTTKAQPYPIEYVQNGGNKEECMEKWQIRRQLQRLADDARSAGRRWDHLLLQVNPTTVVLAMVAPGSDIAAPKRLKASFAPRAASRRFCCGLRAHA